MPPFDFSIQNFMNLKIFKLLLKIVIIILLLFSSVLLGFTDYAFAEDVITPEPEKPGDKATKSSYFDTVCSYR